MARVLGRWREAWFPLVPIPSLLARQLEERLLRPLPIQPPVSSVLGILDKDTDLLMPESVPLRRFSLRNGWEDAARQYMYEAGPVPTQYVEGRLSFLLYCCPKLGSAHLLC